MNDEDRKNLNFIMRSEEKHFDAWLDEATSDDVEYALELVRQAKLELMVQEAEYYDEVVELTEANKVLDRIRKLKK